MGDEDLGKTIMEGFLGDIPKQIANLKQYLKNSDMPGVERQAHTIKGASANVGGEVLRALAFKMEKAGKAGDMDAVKADMQKLEKCFDRLKEEADRHLG